MNKQDIFEALKYEVFSQEGVLQMIESSVDAFLELDTDSVEVILHSGMEVFDLLGYVPKETYFRHFEGINDEDELEKNIEMYYEKELFTEPTLFVGNDAVIILAHSKNDKLKEFDNKFDSFFKENVFEG